MRLQHFLLMLLIFTMAPRLRADEITVSEYLDLIKTSHPYFLKENLNAEIDRKDGESLLGGQEWVFSIMPYYNRFGEVTAAPAKGMDNMGGKIQLGKSIWETGGRLDFSLQSDYIRTTGVESYVFTAFPPSISSVDTDTFKQSITISYFQPLLKNLGGKLYRLGYDLSQYTVKSDEVLALENQEGFLLNLATKFIDWSHYGEQIRLSKERLALAEEQLAQTTKRFSANLVDRVDVIRAEDAVRSADQGIIQQEAQWKAMQAGLAVVAQSDEINRLSPKHDLYALQSLPDIEASTAKLMSQARLLQPISILERQLEHQRKGTEAKMQPELNLTVKGSLLGSDESFAESIVIKHPDLHVDLELRVPTDYQTEKATIEKIAVQIEQLHESIKDIRITLLASLKNLLIQISETEKVLAINQELIKSAQERTQEELKLYNQGRGQLNFVIQARDNEANAKLNYAQNAANYQKLFLQYQALMDELHP